MTTTKDRVAELREKQREPLEKDLDDAEKGKGAKGGKNNDPMNAFLLDVEDIGLEIQNVSRVVQILTTSYKKPKTDKDWQIVEEHMAEVKRMANRVRGKLKRMDVQIKGNSDDESAEYRIMRTQHLTLTRNFIDVMKDFNKRQQNYREQAMALIKRELGDGISQTQLDHVLEGQAHAHVELQQVTKKQHLDKTHLHEVEARHRDIKRLENNIRELHDMWMDMAMMVERQGDMIDRIEFNVGQTRDYTEQAGANTKKALEQYRQAMKKKRICKIIVGLLVFLIVFGVVMGILSATHAI